ncbi:type II toxin-antitoxin system RelE/ParE family toxin [Cerasicoccus fimbriatus]|uniref:type II toxin-antitoxin system RelE/ParE family toxin n=1 Tax=Cerasicoccus fimbriatus TaxID=3014554 RepID=UPI0022B4CFA6|nr:type II toxin-antitoxin system RelE/ParE family toxin [Cerasicoccus sp. TK19100]
MAFKVIVAPSARQDLSLIIEYIAQRDPAAAERIGLSIISTIKRIGEFPRIGRIVPEFGWDTIREIVFKNYRLIYRIKDEEMKIEVVRIWHAKRGHPLIP